MTIPAKLWSLITSAQRREAIVLLVLMLIGTALETLGVGLVIPALAFMTQDDFPTRYPVLGSWLSGFDNPRREQLVVAGMLALTSVAAVKALILSLLAWRQMRFVYEVEAELSQRLFTNYLRQPYAFHLQRNSAQLLYTVKDEANSVTFVVMQAVTAVTDILIFLGISLLLLAVEPEGTLIIVVVLGASIWGFHRLTRGHILGWGVAQLSHERLRLQHLQQGFGAAKDVLLLGREDDFLNQHRRHSADSAKLGARQAALQMLPRIWLELLAISGLVMLALIIIRKGDPLETLLPTLGVFTAAAIRLMPLATRVLGAIQSARYRLPVVDTVYSELHMLDATPAPQRGPRILLDDVLMLDQVSFRYPSAEAMALIGVSLSISRGISVGIIGESGSGKSTLVDILLGLLAPISGTVTVDGINIQTHLRSWQAQIGYVPQAIFLTDDTLRRNVAFGLANTQIDEVAVWRAIEAAQLEEFVRSLPLGLDSLVGERGTRLSGGQRQRIGIARALYHNPSVLVLDEATSALDDDTERGVMNAVRALQGDKTIIIVAHRLSTIAHCTRFFRLSGGRLVEGSEAEFSIGALGE